jgi:hypothetical protein
MVRRNDTDQEQFPGFQSLAEAVPTPIKRAAQRPRRTVRVIQAAVTITEQERPDIAYQHSVLCQCALPFRDPGDDIREWERSQGRVSLLVRAGSAMHPEKGRLVKVGLPFGAKPRLILAFLNTQAILTDNPVIEVEDSLTSFTDRIGFTKDGRTIRTVKDQLTRLSAADFTFGIAKDGRAWTTGGRVVSGFELWFPKNEQQRVLWPTQVQLSQDYFQSLRDHAVPLNLEALGALKESALALDVYTWLAQRLWRVHPQEKAFITWAAIKDQFGRDYARMRDFKRKFGQALRDVLAVYPQARVEADDRGLTLRHSPPPIRRRLISKL